MKLARITGFRLVSAQPERLLRFYEAIGFRIGTDGPIAIGELAMLGVDRPGHRHRMTLGKTAVDLDRFDDEARGYPAGTNAASRCFQHLALITDDIAHAWEKARSAGARLISRDGPVTLPQSAGGVTAVKFRDPEGHPLEFLTFPDMTAKDWKGTGVIGIDHSAIVATDLDASVAFYRMMGLERGDASLNHGGAQAALDRVDDPRVDVVPMQPDTGAPHVELLHYRQPAGAPSPAWRVDDIAATRIVWAGDAPALIRDLDGHFHQVDVD
ncbi:MAG: VOC family protein [Sphingomonas bacterium]|nr:VOC family protein [Sphingomonas bacterium]